MSSRIKCFFMEPTDQVALWLRRYTLIRSSSPREVYCQAEGSNYHSAKFRLEDAAAIYEPESRPGLHGLVLADRPENVPRDDPRWPQQCQCGYEFQASDSFQIAQDQIYRRLDTGETFPLREAPIGAMFFADWMLVEGSSFCRGPDGHCLCVRIPGQSRYHDWMVDARCRNCTLPKDNDHRCWIRHGDPRTGLVTVDKDGHTCEAGGGSISVPGYHGHLVEGYLVQCG